MRKTLSLLFTLGLGLGIGGSFTHLLHSENAQARPQPQQVEAYNPQLSLAPLVEALSPAVVNIDIQVAVQMPDLPLLTPFGYEGGERIETGQGSGFLISPDGYLLTNYHVVEGANNLKVNLSDDKSYTGRVVGFDDSIDIALVKIDAEEDLPYVSLGTSEELRVGDWVVAIGNPFGLSHTVTTGIISAKGRVIGSGPYDDFLQTDASINPGNSGGPLFNLQGEVIGINTAINPRAQGIGFSVPIDKVTAIIDDLKENGRTARGWLGVGLQPLSDSLKEKHNLEGGAIVSQVYNGTPAQKAGLRTNDIIVQFGKQPVVDTDSLIRIVGNYRSGDKVDMNILRNGKAKKLSVTLGQRPTERELSQGTFIEGPSNPSTPDSTPGALGVRVAEVNGFDQNNLMRRGLVIVQIANNSIASSQLQTGDIIVDVNGSPMTSAEELSDILASKKKELHMTIYRNGTRQKITLDLGK